MRIETFPGKCPKCGRKTLIPSEYPKSELVAKQTTHYLCEGYFEKNEKDERSCKYGKHTKENVTRKNYIDSMEHVQYQRQDNE